MKNKDQIRAKNAIKAAEKRLSGKQGGEVIKKVPPLIMNHGLLALGAYAFDEKTGFKGALDAIAAHLADKDVGLLPPRYPADTQGLMDYLSNEADSDQLKMCTVEAMAWLDYARRFIKK
ncbi:MAG: type III-B CRISPR module-associated protein Cmr5 [Kiritimatiellae bacterium]|nr:type III-B CRISPR module-associated protein Cmr5 [Kiritimatiellia bacterium]MDD4025905.1 type III-B CRISPR module-associated protein Cmr5 [Kiritimatiellia bacterium]